jgi:hypothetical protein
MTSDTEVSKKMRKFEPKREDVTRELKNLRNEVLNILHSFTNIMKMITANTILVGKPEWKRIHDIHMCRRGDNMKMGLKKIDCRCGLDRVQWRNVIDTIVNIYVSQKLGNFLTT